MEDEIPEPVWVGKTDVAERQLSEAIRLFFNERDPVAVHTLVAAAHQILVDIARQKGFASAVKPVRKTSAEEAEHNRRVNFAINFMKHADRDADKKINISPLSIMTQDLLLDAVQLLLTIDSDLPIEAKTFWTWFVSHRQDEFVGSGPATDSLIEHDLASWSFKDIAMFLEFAEVVSDSDEPENNSRDRTSGSSESDGS